VKKTLIIFLALVVVLMSKASGDLPLKLIATTPLPGFEGDLEFFAADVKGNRLFLCAENHKTVEVFNLQTGKRIRSIGGFGVPHDILFLPDSNSLIVTDGGEGFGWVELVSVENYKIVDKIKLPSDVDEAVYNPINKYFYVQSGGEETGGKTHLLNIIDTSNFKLVGSITLPGNHSNAMATDHSGTRLYVNLTSIDEVGVVDLETRQLIARWPVPEAHHPNSIAIDEVNHRLFTATHQPAKFFVFDTVSGKVVATLPCTGLNDHMTFDAARRRIYVTGTETASVFEQRDADHYEHIADVPTGYRAKTSLFVPELNRLYVALSGKERPGAKLAVHIYQVQP
jgi:DNA-binding beta-propeller fold protein YncE